MIHCVYVKRSLILKEQVSKFKCHKFLKKPIVSIGILELPEKSELLLIVTAKLLQNNGN